MSDAKTLAAEKLESSGLTLADAKLLNITWAENGQKLDASYPTVPVLVFHYMDPATGKPFQYAPEWPEYTRIRTLKDPAGFASQTKQKPLRYKQPPDSGLAAYFPSNINWKKILDDPSEPIIITEGELKASKACKEGFATIGLGGVNSFTGAKHGIGFLKELDSVNWVKRRVTICYDSDTQTNENVANATNTLAERLAARGAVVQVLPMPGLEGYEKTGLDDFLLEQKADGLTALMDASVKSLTAVRQLWSLNDLYVYIQNPGIIFKKPTGQKISPSLFMASEIPMDFSEQYMTTNGVALRQVSLSTAWLKWPLRHKVETLTYAPGKEQLIEPGSYRSAWNTWPGWGIEPTKGSVKPFIELIDHLFTGASREAKQWFLQWLAYPLQHPGTKLFTSVLLWGVRHGTGKSIIGYTMGKIYGKNFTELNQQNIDGNFNEWAENKQFVMGDDITGTDKRHDSDRLKKLITQKEIRLNIKHVQSFVIPDCINYYFTANGPTTLFLEDDDRRSFVHEITADPLGEAFYKKYDAWLHGDGPAALFHYLVNEVDCSAFNPAAPALRTEAKERMIADVRSDIGEWVNMLLTNPEEILKVGQISLHHDMFTNKELLALYDPEGRSKVTANGLGRELRRVGVHYALGGNTIKTKKEVNRFYIVRNKEKWEGSKLAEIQTHLNDAPTPMAKKKY
jgi:hypothetical protein